MKLGLHVPDFTWGGGPAAMAEQLAGVAVAAEEAGFDRLSVMDHLWQIPMVGPVDRDMLEAYTTLGFLAGRTRRIRLLALVTAVVYRAPGLLAKEVATLDVLSGGRAMLGIGAAWFEDEARGLGLDFPPLSERYERLDEALRIVQAMWGDDDGPWHGRHYHLDATRCVPRPLTRPRPPILIGGSGERRTLRLVARHADACNVFGGPDVGHKLAVLDRHCETEGRDPRAIERTVLTVLDPGPAGEHVDDLLGRLRALADLGVAVAHGSLPDVADRRRIEILGERVVPEIRDW